MDKIKQIVFKVRIAAMCLGLIECICLMITGLHLFGGSAGGFDKALIWIKSSVNYGFHFSNVY